jgi:hypothetical protein
MNAIGSSETRDYPNNTALEPKDGRNPLGQSAEEQDMASIADSLS